MHLALPVAASAVLPEGRGLASAALRGVPVVAASAAAPEAPEVLEPVAPGVPGLLVGPGSGVAPVVVARGAQAAVGTAAVVGASSLPCLPPTSPSRFPRLPRRTWLLPRTSTTVIWAIAGSAAGIAVAADAVAAMTSVAIGKGFWPM